MTQLLRMTVLLLTLLSTTNKLFSQSCEKLIHYRKIELVTQFDNATQKYKDKYKIISEAIADMQKHKTELLNERGWDEFMSIGTSISEHGVTTAQIASTIKTNCDLLLGLIEMMPGESVAAAAIKKIKLTAEQTYIFIKAGKDLKEIVEGNLETVGYKYMLDEMNIAGKATKTAIEFHENLNKLIEIPEERKKLKSEVIRIMNMLDNAILKYQQDLEKAKVELNNKIEIEQGITKYITENCNELSLKKTSAKLPQKDASNQVKATIEDKKAASNAFYIFLTTTLEIKPKTSQFSNLQSSKTTYIISKPFLHQGNLTDNMQYEKQQFIADIQKHFSNDPDFSLELNSAKQEIHLGKPYSTEVLKKTTEAFEAIEAYKSFIREALEGLAQFDFLQL